MSSISSVELHEVCELLFVAVIIQCTVHIVILADCCGKAKSCPCLDTGLVMGHGTWKDKYNIKRFSGTDVWVRGDVTLFHLFVVRGYYESS